ncbi:MAG: hypothetical protein FWF53_09020 [Candidatus Azobacteroides sp.]|nr:hypothetical protein [Candidatus Azobacteroides sp.]
MTFNAALRINELNEVVVVEKVHFRKKDINFFRNTVLGENLFRKVIIRFAPIPGIWKIRAMITSSRKISG